MNKALVVALSYLVVGLLWIFFSDALVFALWGDLPEVMQLIQNYKGYTFVILSAVLVYVFVTQTLNAEKRGSKLISQTESRLINAQQVSKTGSWETDLVTLSIYWSDETYRIFELDPAQFKPTHTTFLEYVHPDDKEMVDAAFKKSFLSPEINSIEHRIVTVNNNLKYVEENWQIMFDAAGKPVAAAGTCHDITEQKKAEEAILESERKYRYLFENNPMPIWVTDLAEQRFLAVNQAAINHYGYTREEFLNLTAFDIRPEEEKEAFRRFLEKEIYGVNTGAIWTHLKKNGEQIEAEVIAHHIDFEHKKARLVLINDVTEKLKTQAQLAESYKQVQRLASHLQSIREQERTHIAREIHDELGQQLTAIKFDASWLKRQLKEGDERIQERLTGLISLIDHTVKTVRRISSELRPGIIDELGLAETIEWQSREFEKRTGIKIKQRISTIESEVDKDIAINIFRVYQETLTNISRHAAATLVETTLEEKDGNLLLTVKDNGTGFDLEEVKDKKTLGITGMKERAFLFRGHLIIESRKGEGTLIQLVVPLHKQNE